MVQRLAVTRPLHRPWHRTQRGGAGEAEERCQWLGLRLSAGADSTVGSGEIASGDAWSKKKGVQMEAWGRAEHCRLHLRPS